MILFTILALILIALTIIAVAVLSIGGTIGMVIFGDLIVCIFIVLTVIKKVFFKKRH